MVGQWSSKPPTKVMRVQVSSTAPKFKGKYMDNWLKDVMKEVDEAWNNFPEYKKKSFLVWWEHRLDHL